MSEGGAGHEPIIDPLTGAYSRGLLDPRLAEELSRAARSSTGCALFLFDVDYFKSVNDAYGHARGDEVLRQLADRIAGLIRGYDVLFRYGGDEFVLLLPDTAQAEAVRVALRLVQEVRDEEFAGDPALRISISLGVAVFPDDANDAPGLLACADRRNYIAKHRGRACAVADDADVDARPVSSRLLERDIALVTVREFLTRLVAEGRGALRVVGEPGAGHTRFLEEAIRAARLRGFEVVRVPAEPPAPASAGRSSPGVLVVADRGAAAAVDEVLHRVASTDPPPATLGLIYATSGNERPAADPPVLDTVELLAWSAAALRIWVRTALQGEPSPVLVDWLVNRSGGLPGRTERELDRLIARNGLARTEAGAWTVAPALLTRTVRQRRSLPVSLTELVGRQNETAQIAQVLADRRLVTLVGPGGIGKTRLCLAVAAAVAEQFGDGVLFVELASASTADMVLTALGRALDVTAVPGTPLGTTVCEHLTDQSVLLILDNFEQVLTAAPLVSEILEAAPGVRILVSSRERLSLYAEQVYRVPPLPLPDPAALRPGPEGVALAMASSPAMALFNSRARAAVYGFAVTEENFAAVAELCRRLDGLPLAIELAAARSDAFAPAEMLAQLHNHLELPGPGPRDLPGRQQSLHGAIGWSVALLDPPDRELFGLLSVFAGGCREDAVATVYYGDPDVGMDLDKRLTGLADKNLLRAETDGEGDVRYTMLETIQAYAMEQLAESDHVEQAYRRHAAHYTAFAKAAGHELTGPDQGRWAGRIEREYQNLRVAFDRALDQSDPTTAIRIGLGLWRFWRTGRHLEDGREWLDRLLGSATPLPEGVRAQVLHAASVLAGAQDDHVTAHALADESLRGARRVGDVLTTAQACNALGTAALAAGDYFGARGFFAEGLAISEANDSLPGAAIAHGSLSKVALRIGDLDTASEHAARCLELDRQQGNTRGIMLGLLCLGEIKLARWDTDGAREHLQEGLALSRTVGDVFGEATALHQLGKVALRDGDPAEAIRLVSSGLVLRRNVGDREDLAISLDSLGALLASGHGELAARLLGAAETLRTQHRLPPPADGESERVVVLATLRSTLEESTLASAWTAGQSAPLDTVVDELLDHVAAAPRR